MKQKPHIDEFYILARAPRTEHHTRVLKQGESFAVFDLFGDLHSQGLGDLGLYHEGTRYLSRLELRMDQNTPLLFLSSTIQKTNEMMTVDLMNPDIFIDNDSFIPRGALHIFRSIFLWEAVCYSRIRITNFGMEPATVPISFLFDADFADIFEVRGTTRKRRGQRLEDVTEDSSITLSYEGLDGKKRKTRLEFLPRPEEIISTQARFEFVLQPRDESVIFLTISCDSITDQSRPRCLSYDKAFGQVNKAMDERRSCACEIYTSNEQFNDWLNRSLADLFMMITETPQGPYPYAGVPWFSTAFGRDGIITALQLLWIDPQIARGVLAYLAATQAQKTIPEQEAEPGKILHETRSGEMANLGEIPFKRYYGSVDATPLFVVLAGAYQERTGDLQFIESIWPNIEAALEWIFEYGDVDKDGFIEYAGHSEGGLIHQGWKDSHDSVFHADGAFPEGPIALCEVQGYVYDALRKAGHLVSQLGHQQKARELLGEARGLKERFDKAFWHDDLFSYALALDGGKRPCTVRASNAGHTLFSGICTEEHARATAQTLMSQDFFSGWGIRTVASSELRYNPMSYHNGSIWPHDNSLIGYGMARYGFKNLALKVLTALFDASIYFDLSRLPELFCGFRRRPGQGPTLYPVACAPQSWAVGSPFLLLQAVLGLSIDANREELRFSHAQLPRYLEQVQIKNLQVGTAAVDLLIERHAEDVTLNVLRKQGRVEILMIK